MAIPAAEASKSRETNTPQEPGEKKGISARFQKAKAKVASFSTTVKQAFTQTVTNAPETVVFDAEKHELDQLTEKLVNLNLDTEASLGIASSGEEEAPPPPSL